MAYTLVKATCPVCGKVENLISTNPIPRLRCADCLVDRVEIVDMILSVEEEKD